MKKKTVIEFPVASFLDISEILRITSIVRVTRQSFFLNPLNSKIWLSVLPSSYNTFPCKLVMRIWCKIKIKTLLDKF